MPRHQGVRTVVPPGDTQPAEADNQHNFKEKPCRASNFRQPSFFPIFPNPARCNPGAYGFELASWLSLALAKAGYPTRYPTSEEWGWYIEYLEDEAEFMIGCGCQAEEGEGYKGTPVPGTFL